MATAQLYQNNRKAHQRRCGFFRVYKSTPGINGGNPEMHWGKEYFTYDEALRDLLSEYVGRTWEQLQQEGFQIINPVDERARLRR
jgi:hypothetical protein